jgi:hypothetical protein
MESVRYGHSQMVNWFVALTYLQRTKESTCTSGASKYFTI